MEKDKAIRNQKVFVSLQGVLAVQKRYLAIKEINRLAGMKPEAVLTIIDWRNKEREYGIAEVITALNLPITL